VFNNPLSFTDPSGYTTNCDNQSGRADSASGGNCSDVEGTTTYGDREEYERQRQADAINASNLANWQSWASHREIMVNATAGLYIGLASLNGGSYVLDGHKISLSDASSNSNKSVNLSVPPWEKYASILKIGGIDLKKNFLIATKLSPLEWKLKVQTGGDWDYKNSQLLKDAGIASKLLDEFGNFHFGVVALAQSYNLSQSMYGAGFYQVISQGGGSRFESGVATWVMSTSFGGGTIPNDWARGLTNSGFGWGDNPGDAVNIMNGWDYARQNFVEF
jgi:hypothetical protein